ncbi:hypothetical protein [Parasitella parasitica]|uniref:Uncharacterized protein n=1 Tax=Parasitella parasitica TaxID=35722 RepID=A0A0B7NHK2_9FUNG|nr:hypothetical protein [Parasitella parasitica]
MASSVFSASAATKSNAGPPTTSKAGILTTSNAGLSTVPPLEEFEDMGFGAPNYCNDFKSPRMLRDEYWASKSKELFDGFSRSHNIYSHADPCLKSPILVGAKPTYCDFQVRSPSRNHNWLYDIW